MSQELAAVAEAGAAAVVAAMATEVWQSTRAGLLRLFHRGDEERRAALAAQLDNNAALVEAAAAPDDVRRAVLAYWSGELTALLHADSSCRQALAQLAAEVAAALPNERGAGVLQQTNTAHDLGTVLAVQQGDLHASRRAASAPSPGTGRSSGR
ncbi:hypothetical protein ABZY93_01425 [Streptomyces smyrnaeus]|uniref:hypothetical protein n=1 Tax=Streptomyces smyrnaeus TaxID=1387713 RepID=UPI0033B7AB80